MRQPQPEFSQLALDLLHDYYRTSCPDRRAAIVVQHLRRAATFGYLAARSDYVFGKLDRCPFGVEDMRVPDGIFGIRGIEGPRASS